MSTAARFYLVVAILVTSGAIWAAHFAPVPERQGPHDRAGVVSLAAHVPTPVPGSMRTALTDGARGDNCGRTFRCWDDSDGASICVVGRNPADPEAYTQRLVAEFERVPGSHAERDREVLDYANRFIPRWCDAGAN